MYLYHWKQSPVAVAMADGTNKRMNYDGCATSESKYATIVLVKAVFVLERMSQSGFHTTRKVNTT